MHNVRLPRPRAKSMMHDMNLARIRQARGLTQTDLAEMVGLNQATIQRAESMHKSAKLATYRMCAKALGVSLSDLFSEDRAAAHDLLLAAFDALPAARQQAWLAMADLAQKEAALEAVQNSSAANQK